MTTRSNTSIDQVPEICYIYESPDGGLTVYRREIGSDERELVRQDPSIIERQNLAERTARLIRIARLAKTDETLANALEQIEILYILKYGENDKDD
jgi:hypothetical protein